MLVDPSGTVVQQHVSLGGTNSNRLYLTEGASKANGLFYRSTPERLPGALHNLPAGGLLEPR